MNKHSRYFIITTLFLLSLLSLELIYMYTSFKSNIEEKNSFVKLVGLPDLSISNEAHFVRHRSLSDTFSMFSNGPELLEYFPSTFTYSYSQNYKNTTSRIELEK